LSPGSASPLRSLWQSVKRIDKSKLNGWIAVRNTFGVVVALSAGIALGKPSAGAAAAAGALNIAYSDGRDPYRQRVRRMLLWSVLGAIAVFTGSATGAYAWPAILVVAVWAFLAGMAVSLGTRAGDLGLNTLVTLTVFAARAALSPRGALAAAGLFLAGALLQTLFAIVLWPVRRDEPERRAIRRLYAQLAANIEKLRAEDVTEVPAVETPADLQDTVAAVGRDLTAEGERMRFLLDQIDRLQLSAFAIHRLIAAWKHRKGDRADRTSGIIQDLDRLLQTTAGLLANVDQAAPDALSEFDEIAHRVCDKTENADGLAEETKLAADTLRIQLHTATHLAAADNSTGEVNAEQRRPPARLQVRSSLETLRANLNLRSATFRHAVRLSVCVAVADAITRGIDWQRSYWMPMTVAVILKPDFTTTVSRGILRLGGTFAGLGLATVLYHICPEKAVAEIVLVGTFTLMLRSIGPANYGVFSVAVSGLIVFLIAVTGIAPKSVISQRAVNTLAGGVLALVAYGAWPTWERRQASEILADFLDACRAYFQAVARKFASDDDSSLEWDLDRTRTEARRARSNAAASVDRLSGEPATKADELSCITSMMASASAVLQAIMALEAALIDARRRTAPDVIVVFAQDVDQIFYFLATALRGSPAAWETLPSLNEDHRRILKNRAALSDTDEFIVLEIDRLAVSLGTLREQVMQYLHAPRVRQPEPYRA